MKFITRYEMKVHGVENSQYWQGYKSDKHECTYVGIGKTISDAAENAMDQAASDEWDVDGEQSKANRVESPLLTDKTSMCDTINCINRNSKDGCDMCELHYYVSLALT